MKKLNVLIIVLILIGLVPFFLISQINGSEQQRLTPNSFNENPFNYSGQYSFHEEFLLPEENQYIDYILSSSAKEHISPALVLAVIRQESNFDPQDESESLANGLMQVKYIAAKDAGYPYDEEQWLIEGKNPETNIKYGVSYLRLIHERKLAQKEDASLESVLEYYYGKEDYEQYVSEVKFGRDEINGLNRGYYFFLSIRKDAYFQLN